MPRIIRRRPTTSKTEKLLFILSRYNDLICIVGLNHFHSYRNPRWHQQAGSGFDNVVRIC